MASEWPCASVRRAPTPFSSELAELEIQLFDVGSEMPLLTIQERVRPSITIEYR